MPGAVEQAQFRQQERPCAHRCDPCRSIDHRIGHLQQRALDRLFYEPLASGDERRIDPACCAHLDRAAHRHACRRGHCASVRRDQDQFVAVAEPARLVQHLRGAGHVEHGDTVEDHETHAMSHV